MRNICQDKGLLFIFFLFFLSDMSHVLMIYDTLSWFLFFKTVLCFKTNKNTFGSKKT